MMGRFALRIPPSGSNTDMAPSGMPSPAAQLVSLEESWVR